MNFDLDEVLSPARDRTEEYAFIVGIKRAAAEGAPVGIPGGQYAAPIESVVQAITAMIAHEFKLSQMYAYYAEMLKGLDRGALAEVFSQLSYDERQDATYFLRRLSALVPGGAPLPAIPPPQPLPDPESMLDTMIAEEQKGILMLQQLLAFSGEAPMKYDVEQRIADEQRHLDKLFQFKPAADPKVAFVQERLRRKLANPMAAYEQQMLAAQAQNEAAFLRDQLHQTQAQLADAAEQAQQGQAAVQEAQQQAQEAVMQADQAQQDALAGQSAAAEHANAKLRLAQRIQQMRQTLADLAAQDPVAEEGVGVDPTLTATQQQAAQDPNVGPNAQQAQDPTQQQAQPPAPQSSQPSGSGTHVTVKSSANVPTNLGSAATSLAKKLRPTQMIAPVNPMAAARHMAQHNPALAIQAGRQGAPVVGNAKVLEELARSSFGKLAKRMRTTNGAVDSRVLSAAIGLPVSKKESSENPT